MKPRDELDFILLFLLIFFPLYFASDCFSCIEMKLTHIIWLKTYSKKKQKNRKQKTIFKYALQLFVNTHTNHMVYRFMLTKLLHFITIRTNK